MREKPFNVLILLGGLGWLAGCHHYRAGGEQQKAALQIPKETPHRPQGSAALVVKAGAAEPFTKQDVIDYFKTHNLPMTLSTTNDFTVDKLEFLTNKEVTDRLNGASPGLNENDNLGFATLKGLFIFTGPPPGRPVRFSQAYAVFDGATGNLLMVGTLGQGEQPR